MTYHIPVLLDECIQGLNIDSNAVYVDCTAGGGGHSRVILDKLSSGKLIAFDQDPDSPCSRWEDDRFLFVPSNFRYLGEWLDYYDIDQVDGILADLGVSSHQLDEAQRGFAHKFDSLLDMRMSQSAKKDAAEILNSYQESRLADVFWQFGEYRRSRQLAKLIITARKSITLKKTSQLNELVGRLEKKDLSKVLSKVYQALRIEVNDEMAALDALLDQAVSRLKSGGRLVIMSYHSLEDRRVKLALRPKAQDDGYQGSVYEQTRTDWKLITRKPITPSNDEIEQNPRSRSARLRIAQRI